MPRIAIAQFRPQKGDYAANLAKIGGILADGDYARAGLYMAGTIVGCLAAVLLGSIAAGRLL